MSNQNRIGINITVDIKAKRIIILCIIIFAVDILIKKFAISKTIFLKILFKPNVYNTMEALSEFLWLPKLEF